MESKEKPKFYKGKPCPNLSKGRRCPLCGKAYVCLADVKKVKPA